MTNASYVPHAGRYDDMSYKCCGKQWAENAHRFLITNAHMEMRYLATLANSLGWSTRCRRISSRR